jgi:hypothetical protein
MQIDVAVGEHDPFRLGAGSARVEDLRHGILVHVHDVCAMRQGVGEQIQNDLLPHVAIHVNRFRDWLAFH